MKSLILLTPSGFLGLLACNRKGARFIWETPLQILLTRSHRKTYLIGLCGMFNVYARSIHARGKRDDFVKTYFTIQLKIAYVAVNFENRLKWRKLHLIHPYGWFMS